MYCTFFGGNFLGNGRSRYAEQTRMDVHYCADTLVAIELMWWHASGEGGVLETNPNPTNSIILCPSGRTKKRNFEM